MWGISQPTITASLRTRPGLSLAGKDRASCQSGGAPALRPGAVARPLRGLQESRVATREESGVLGFPSRRGLTPRGTEGSGAGGAQLWM